MSSFLQSNDLNPIWNEHFEFTIEDADTQSVTVKIYDDDGIQVSELIGCAQVRLKDLQPGKVKDVWLKLVKDLEIQRDRKDRGQVSLFFKQTTAFFFHFLSLENRFRYHFRSRFSISSQLIIYQGYGYITFFL